MTDPVPVTTGPARPAGAQPAAAVAIGVFDGVHRGHRWLLGRARAAADRAGLPLTVLTFDPHPMAVVRPDAAPPELASLAVRTRLLGQAGADRVRVLTFDREASLLSPQQFVADYLHADLAAHHVVVGRNFRFGHRAAGDVALLADLGRGHGFDVEPVALHADPDGQVWSSSRIRALLADGDVATAAHGLDRHHRVEGLVQPGDRRGRDLGYPTANVAVPPQTCRPADGVYAGWLLLDPNGPDAQRLPAAISVGANRTFDGTQPRVEAYALDREDLQLYGQHVAVEFLDRLRPMHRFADAGQLVAAMAADVTAARALIERNSPAGSGPTA